MFTDPIPQQSDKLKCEWLSWETSPAPDHLNELVLNVPELSYPDMAGCVETAKALNPGVTDILVFNPKGLINYYSLNDGNWADIYNNPRSK